MAIVAPAIEWNLPATDNLAYHFPISVPAVSLDIDQQRKLTEAVRNIHIRDIRRCLAGNVAPKSFGFTHAFIAGYLLGERSITLTEAGQFKVSTTPAFKGVGIAEVFVDQLKIHSYVNYLGRLGFVDIAIRFEELWPAVEDEDDYNSINTTSLKNAVDALTMKRWKQRPAIVVERDGTVAVKWSNDAVSLLMAFLPDGMTWFKTKHGSERRVNTLPAQEALEFAKSMLTSF